MTLTVGVDIVEISRIEAAVLRYGERFLARVYTQQELAYAAGRLPALATRWAAKEATAKALGTGIGPMSFRDIEVVCNLNGQPGLRLHGTAAQLAERLNLRRFAVSLSHVADYALAFVAAQA